MLIDVGAFLCVNRSECLKDRLTLKEICDIVVTNIEVAHMQEKNNLWGKVRT